MTKTENQEKENMSFQEKRSIAYLVSILIILGLYWVYGYQNAPDDAINPTRAFHFWGSVILLLIPAQIALNIIMHIIFSVIHTITTKEEESSLVDERDKLFELKATRNGYYVFMAGFLISMITIVMNMPPSVMFNLLVLSLFASQIAWVCSQIYFYRRGY